MSSMPSTARLNLQSLQRVDVRSVLSVCGGHHVYRLERVRERAVCQVPVVLDISRSQSLALEYSGKRKGCYRNILLYIYETV